MAQPLAKLAEALQTAVRQFRSKGGQFGHPGIGKAGKRLLIPPDIGKLFSREELAGPRRPAEQERRAPAPLGAFSLAITAGGQEKALTEVSAFMRHYKKVEMDLDASSDRTLF